MSVWFSAIPVLLWDGRDLEGCMVEVRVQVFSLMPLRIGYLLLRWLGAQQRFVVEVKVMGRCYLWFAAMGHLME